MFSIIQKHAFYYWLFVLFFSIMLIYQYTEPQFTAIYFFSAHRTAVGNFFFRWITEFGDSIPYLLMIVLFMLLKNRNQVLKIAFVAAFTGTVAYILKNIFLHDRPGTILEHLHLLTTINWVPNYPILKGHFSFPSGHSMSAFALWTTLSCYKGWTNKFFSHLPFRLSGEHVWQFLCFFIAASICLSRMYLGAHFPQDVLLGAVIGITIATGIEYLVDEKIVFTGSDDV